MKALQQVLAEADQQKTGVGHFNVSDLVALKAVYLAARELNVPVIVGVSKVSATSSVSLKSPH